MRTAVFRNVPAKGIPVLSTEALKTGKDAVLSKPFDVVALDKEGCYLTKSKQVLKKYVPTDGFTNKFCKKFKKAFSIAEKAEKYSAAGELSAANAQKAIKNAWRIVVAAASKGKIH